MVLIGITGTMGAGKGTVVEYLCSKKGFVHYSARTFISEEIVRRGLPVNRDTMTSVANDLRKIHSPSYILEALLDKAVQAGKDAIIESIRTEGEVEALRKKGGVLVSVDADQRLRYERIYARKSETDSISFETFVAHEERERLSTDPGKQSISSVMQKADIHLMNNGAIEELEQALECELTQRGLYPSL